MTELELLQQKHREDAAARREQFKERKRRAHRLIERGAMLESAVKDICPPESLTDKQMEQIIYFAIQRRLHLLSRRDAKIPSNFQEEGRTYYRPWRDGVRSFGQPAGAGNSSAD